MSERELKLAEEREWSVIAGKVPIPHRYRNAHLIDAQQTAAIKATREFLDDDDNDTRSIWLAGPTGTGKTFALVAAFRQEAVGCDGKGLEFWRMGELVRQLITEGGDDIFDQCIECDTLYVDDVGSCYLKDGGLAEARFEEIVVAREADEAPMLCTTNLTLPRLAEVLGDRIADRVAGPWADWIGLPGASLRRTARPKVSKVST